MPILCGFSESLWTRKQRLVGLGHPDPCVWTGNEEMEEDNFMVLLCQNSQEQNLSLGPLSTSGAEGLDGLAGPGCLSCLALIPASLCLLPQGTRTGPCPSLREPSARAAQELPPGVWSGKERIPTWNRVQVFPGAPPVWGGGFWTTACLRAGCHVGLAFDGPVGPPREDFTAHLLTGAHSSH